MARTAEQIKKRRATAYHETGHAVADHLLGFTTMGATIFPRGNTLGAATQLDGWGSPGNTGRENEREARNWIVSLLAGHAAEVEFCGKHDNKIGGARTDFDRAEELLAFARKPSLDVFRVQARNFVRRHRAKIVRVAEELLRCGSLDDGEVDLLITERGRGLAKYRALRDGTPGRTCTVS